MQAQALQNHYLFAPASDLLLSLLALVEQNKQMYSRDRLRLNTPTPWLKDTGQLCCLVMS